MKYLLFLVLALAVAINFEFESDKAVGMKVEGDVDPEGETRLNASLKLGEYYFPLGVVSGASNKPQGIKFGFGKLWCAIPNNEFFNVCAAIAWDNMFGWDYTWDVHTGMNDTLESIDLGIHPYLLTIFRADAEVDTYVMDAGYGGYAAPFFGSASIMTSIGMNKACASGSAAMAPGVANVGLVTQLLKCQWVNELTPICYDVPGPMFSNFQYDLIDPMNFTLFDEICFEY